MSRPRRTAAVVVAAAVGSWPPSGPGGGTAVLGIDIEAVGVNMMWEG